MRTPKKLFLSTAPALFALAVLSGCSDSSKDAAALQMPAPSVSVITVAREPVGQYNEFVARTEASKTVELRARVEGFLEKRGFIEGETVDKDQLLFSIDPAPFKATLSQAQATLSSAQAEEIRAKADLERGKELYPQGHISKADMDTLVSNEAKAQANVAAGKAQLETARISLSYTKIYAPFSGQIGKETYSVGNLVGPTSSPLAELIKIDPIYVNFQVNERVLMDYQKTHTSTANGNNKFEASLRLPNGSNYAELGTFDFADTKVDETTGTVTMRVTFPNPDKLLLPGLYVTLMVESTRKEDMPLIPQAAVQENQQGRFVLVVNKNNAVETRIVEMGRRIGPMWAVDSGLEAGERIIVSGLQKVRPGVTVNPVMKVVDTTTGTLSDLSQEKAAASAQPTAEPAATPADKPSSEAE